MLAALLARAAVAHRGERFRGHGQLHALFLARAQQHAAKGAKAVVEAVRFGIEIANVRFHNFFALHVAAVAHVHAQFHLLRIEGEVRIIEFRIAQAIAKGIQRLALEIAVGTAAHGVILKLGKLVRRVVEGDRQLAGRRNLAKEDVRQRRAARLPGIPGPQDGVALFHAQRAARRHHGDHRLAGHQDGVHQLPLGFGQFQIDLVAGGILVAGVARLAFDGRIQAQAEDHHIADVRHGHRLGQPVVVLLREIGAPALVEVRAGGVVHADILPTSRADAL